MAGIEVIREIRSSEMNNYIPIIVLTSHALIVDRKKLISAGCRGYIEKQVDPFSVIKQIEEIIGKKL